MYLGVGIVLALIGGVGLLTSQTPEGVVKTIDTIFYWGFIAVGGVLVLVGISKRSKKRR